ncbi:MAG TPA: mechanosensitive ion channel family protein, partial [Acidimicrobiales bacterium]|nr:mechanosensitive ion channel family protein [Acidimicrobiales bacterium]
MAEPRTVDRPMVPPAEPLWTPPGPPPSSQKKKERFTRALVTALGALVAMSISSTLGDVHSRALHEKLFAFVGAGAFLVLAVIAVQSTAGTLTAILRPRAGRSARGAIRILVALFGYIVVFFVELGLLGVPLEHLLIGAGVAGVVLGIAAQQALGNVFAGLVLMLSRPFRIDQRGTHPGRIAGRRLQRHRAGDEPRLRHLGHRRRRAERPQLGHVAGQDRRRSAPGGWGRAPPLTANRREDRPDVVAGPGEQGRGRPRRGGGHAGCAHGGRLPGPRRAGAWRSHRRRRRAGVRRLA